MKLCQLAILAGTIILALLLSHGAAFAGGSDRGGGLAVACTNGSGSQLYDYFEARRLLKLKLDLGDANLDFEGRIEYVLNRLSKVDSLSAERYRRRARGFLKEAKFVTASEMPDIGKEKLILLPADGCQKQRFAVQFFNVKPGYYRYFVDKDLWASADSLTRAGLVLHEVVFSDVPEIENSSKTDDEMVESEGVRYFTSTISSSQVEQLDYDSYSAIVMASKLDGTPRYFSAHANLGNPWLAQIPIAINTIRKDSSSSMPGFFYFSKGEFPKDLAPLKLGPLQVKMKSFECQGSLKNNNASRDFSAEFHCTVNIDPLLADFFGTRYVVNQVVVNSMGEVLIWRGHIWSEKRYPDDLGPIDAAIYQGEGK